MGFKEINLESQISEQDQKSFGGMFSVRKIAIGLTGIVFVVGCGLTYAYKDQIFGSKTDSASNVKISTASVSGAANPAPDSNASKPTSVSGAANPASVSGAAKPTSVSGAANPASVSGAANPAPESGAAKPASISSTAKPDTASGDKKKQLKT